ncbi:MAG TPA: GNAT family N-acetyltransferase [Solirubrobacteraceae bacterium]
MPAAIAPATHEDLDDVLELFAGYQRFYTGDARPDDHNRAFLTRFLAPSDDGLLLVARDAGSGEAMGFANLYWTFSSTRATEHALMNDLFVSESARGTNVGHQLIEAARDAAAQRGIDGLSWMTALDNRQAQRLYERFDADRSVWFEYEVSSRRS